MTGLCILTRQNRKKSWAGEYSTDRCLKMAELVIVEPGGDNLQKGQPMVNGLIDGEQNNAADEGPMIDIAINNVVCSFSVKCHLNLKKIAMEGCNVEYHRQHGVIFI